MQPPSKSNMPHLIGTTNVILRLLLSVEENIFMISINFGRKLMNLFLQKQFETSRIVNIIRDFVITHQKYYEV